MLPTQLYQEWVDLRGKTFLKLHEGICGVDASDTELRQWDDILLQFRKLREALTAANANHGLKREVYELAAVVCAAARNMAELLKCLQRLVNSIYPEQQAATVAADTAAAAAAAAAMTEHKQQQRHHLATEEQQLHQQMHMLLLDEQAVAPTVLQTSNSSRTANFCSSNIVHKTYLLPGFKGSFTSKQAEDACHCGVPVCQQQQQQQKECQLQSRIEVSAALLLYFVCVPRKPIMQEIVKQLRLAAKCSITTSVYSNNISSCKKASTPEPDTPALATYHNSSSCGSLAGKQQQQQLYEVQLLLKQPGYQLAIKAASAALSCNWVQFMRCYEQQQPLLVSTVMECALHRLRVHAVHTVVAGYRMLPSTVLVRWLGVEIRQQHQRQHKDEQQQGDEGDDGWGGHPPSTGNCTTQVLLQVLQAAADGGSKGARVALTHCAGATKELPDTLQFRA